MWAFLFLNFHYHKTKKRKKKKKEKKGNRDLTNPVPRRGMGKGWEGARVGKYMT